MRKQKPEITLRHRIVLVSGFAKPFHRLLVILRHALAVLVGDAEIALRLRIAFLGGFAHLVEGRPRFTVVGHVGCRFPSGRRLLT